MRFRKRTSTNAEPDMTPMIDVTFQLIAFFMFTINYSDAEQYQRVALPASELVKPPEAAAGRALLIQLTETGEFLIAGEALSSLAELRSALLRQKQIIDRHAAQKVVDMTIIIRADQDAPAGRVQEIIQLGHDLGFEKFALRGKQADGGAIAAPAE